VRKEGGRRHPFFFGLHPKKTLWLGAAVSVMPFHVVDSVMMGALDVGSS
jgi:hypothetical protein